MSHERWDQTLRERVFFDKPAITVLPPSKLWDVSYHSHSCVLTSYRQDSNYRTDMSVSLVGIWWCEWTRTMVCYVNTDDVYTGWEEQKVNMIYLDPKNSCRSTRNAKNEFLVIKNITQQRKHRPYKREKTKHIQPIHLSSHFFMYSGDFQNTIWINPYGRTQIRDAGSESKLAHTRRTHVPVGADITYCVAATQDPRVQTTHSAAPAPCW